jgi:nucleotide-binding universal stress UspA family protein
MSGIFVGVDGSTHSQVALDWAIREAGIRQAPLTVITIHEVAASGWGGSLEFPGDEVMRERDKKAVQEVVDKTVAQLGSAAPPQITVQALIGQPAPQLIEASKDADLLVVGSRGGGGFARLLLGSVSTQVAEHAHCPVTIIPHDRRS